MLRGITFKLTFRLLGKNGFMIPEHTLTMNDLDMDKNARKIAEIRLFLLAEGKGKGKGNGTNSIGLRSKVIRNQNVPLLFLYSPVHFYILCRYIFCKLENPV